MHKLWWQITSRFDDVVSPLYHRLLLLALFKQSDVCKTSSKSKDTLPSSALNDSLPDSVTFLYPWRFVPLRTQLPLLFSLGLHVSLPNFPPTLGARGLHLGTTYPVPNSSATPHLEYFYHHETAGVYRYLHILVDPRVAGTR